VADQIWTPAEPVDAYLLTNGLPLKRKPSHANELHLAGHADEVAKHKGHRVEVTGRLLPLRPKGGSGAAAPSIERIAIASVKMLSAECPVKQ
jgi:hypothetical protein